MEGIIHSIGDERKQFKQRISELSKLEKTMHLNLRKFYKREALEQEELERKRREQELLELDERVMSSGSGKNSSVVLELLEEDDIFVEYGVIGSTLSTPPMLLEMSPSSTTSESAPGTPARRVSYQAQQYRYDMAGGGLGSHEDDGIREAPLGLGGGSHSRTLSDPLTHADPIKPIGNKSWEQELFDNGCDLFFCATMPLCAGPSAATSVATPHIQPTSSITEGFPHLLRNDSNGNNSYGDGSTIVSSINFATGLSGHMGAGRQHRRKSSTPYKKHVRMMSQHDGAAHVRRKKGSNSSVVSISDGTKVSVATL